MFGLGPWELLVIFVVIIILFGPKRLPELARSLGRSIKEFKYASRELKEELDLNNIDEPSLPQSTTPPATPEKEQKPEPKNASAEKKE